MKEHPDRINIVDQYVQKHKSYFFKLQEELNDKITAHRWISKEYVEEPPSTIHKVAHALLGTVGVILPGIELVELATCHFLPKAAPYIIHGAEKLGELIVEGVHEVSHSVHHHHYIPPLFTLHGLQNDRFNELIGHELMYRFRYEISCLTIEEIEELATKHFNVILSCLDHYKDRGIIPTITDLYESIINCVAPNPKEAIYKNISEYVINRQDRFFRSGSTAREQFLANLIKDINQPNPDVDRLIYTLSSCVKFYNDTLFKTTESIENDPSFATAKQNLLKNFQVNFNAPENELFDITIFNNPFWTKILRHYHKDDSMKDLIESIVWNLLRWKVLNENGIKPLDKTGVEKYINQIPQDLPHREIPLEAPDADDIQFKIFAEKEELPSQNLSFQECYNTMWVSGQHTTNKIKFLQKYFSASYSFDKLQHNYLRFAIALQEANPKNLPRKSHLFWISMQAFVAYKRESEALELTQSQTYKLNHEKSAILSPIKDWIAADIEQSGLQI